MNNDIKNNIAEQANKISHENNALAHGDGGEAMEVLQANGYFHKKGSLYLAIDGKTPVLISESYIEVTALTRTLDSREWSKQIEFTNMDEKRQIEFVPCRTVFEQKETLKILADAGLDMNCNRIEVWKYLISASPVKRIRQIKRTGWVNDTEYTCPSFIISDQNNKEVFSLAGNTNDYGFTQKGTLEQWQGICRLCEGNNILTFGLCIGLSAPLLRFFPTLGTTIINLVGKTSIGKTTALRVAASIWGNDKFIRQWRSTGNAHEGTAEFYNDALMVLDELGQVDGKEASPIIYMFGNEKGKGRCTADATLKEIKEWKLFILSSGEIGISDKIEESGKKVKGGILVRCIDIDAQATEDLGVFNTLHGHNSGAELSNYLKVQASEYYGTAAEAFIRRLVEDNLDTVREIYASARQRLFDEFGLHESDYPVQRVAEIFALYVTAGTLASVDNYGVLTHNVEGVESAGYAVFRRWLADRGGKKSYEDQEIIQHILDFLMQHEARFYRKELHERPDGTGYDGLPKDRVIHNQLGFIEQHADKTIYYINPTLFKEETCKGFNYKLIRKILIEKGILLTDSDGKDKRCSIIKPVARMVTLVIKDN